MQTLINQIIKDHGVDPTKIYCAVTGAAIGELSSKVLDQLFNSLPANADEETRADEFLLKSLAASRTSPMWTLVNSDHYTWAFDHDTASLFAYMVNRYLSEPNAAPLKGTRDSVTMRVLQLVSLNNLASAALTSESVTSIKNFIFLLIGCDKRHNLMHKGAKPSIPFPNYSDPSSLLNWIAEATKIITPYHDKLVATEIQQQKDAVALTKGNRALHQLWEREHARKVTKTLVSPQAAKKRSIVEDAISLIDALILEGDLPAAPKQVVFSTNYAKPSAKPIAKPLPIIPSKAVATSTIQKGGGKLVFKFTNKSTISE